MSIWVAAAVTALLSMPGLGGGEEDGIDVPAANEIWTAVLTDNTLTDTPLEEFSWDGYAHMQGTLGAGNISIRFSDISRIEFEPTEKNKSLALVTLKTGQVKKIGVDGRVNLYGKTGFGNFKVQIKDVKRIVFRAGVARATPTPSAPRKDPVSKPAPSSTLPEPNGTLPEPSKGTP